MNKQITIGSRKVGYGYKPFIIAEMSGNHNQSIERAYAIIDEAAKCGADAIKLQTYTPDTMTINVDNGLFQINDENSLWKGRNLYDLYAEAHTPWEWHQQLFDYAREKGIFIFSTPFDETAVDFLEQLGVQAYKIASFENTDNPLLIKIASTGKPVIMSTGLATIADLDESVRVLQENGCSDLILLKCTSTYPASPESTNLMTIPHMSELFDCLVGLSDHTMGIGAAIASVALGACVIEKHFTLSRADGGVDSTFSIEPAELKSLVVESERAYLALGSIKYGIQSVEKNSLRFKRSVYAVQDIQIGEEFTFSNIRVIRPGDGLPPKYYEKIVGKISKYEYKKGTPISWENI